MKDKHNVILILDSPIWLIPYSGGSSNSRFKLSIFLFRSFKFPLYLIEKLHLNHCKSSPCVFNFSFISIDHPFVYRSSSWRCYMVVHQGFNSFSKCSSRFFSEELKFFFILQSRVQFFLPYHWRWYYAILDNLSLCFMIHTLLRMRYFKSITLFIGIILGYISPKAFPKDSCYLWSLYLTQVLLLSSRWNSFSSLCLYQSNLLFPLVAEFHLINFEMSSISPHQAYPFVVDNPTTLFENML